MQTENKKVKSKLTLIKLIFIFICIILFFHTSVIWYLEGIFVYGNLSAGFSNMLGNAINSFRIKPISVTFVFILKILCIIVLTRLFTVVEKLISKRKEEKQILNIEDEQIE